MLKKVLKVLRRYLPSFLSYRENQAGVQNLTPPPAGRVLMASDGHPIRGEGRLEVCLLPGGRRPPGPEYTWGWGTGMTFGEDVGWLGELAFTFSIFQFCDMQVVTNYKRSRIIMRVLG